MLLRDSGRAGDVFSAIFQYFCGISHKGAVSIFWTRPIFNGLELAGVGHSLAIF